jgi:hypothetical protein
MIHRTRDRAELRAEGAVTDSLDLPRRFRPEEDMATHAVGVVVVDGADFEIDGLDAAEGVLDGAEVFVTLDDVVGREAAGREAGAHDVETVGGGFPAQEEPCRLTF